MILAGILGKKMRFWPKLNRQKTAGTGKYANEYSGARLIRTANVRKIRANIQACELSKPILRYVIIKGRELCPEQACELSGGLRISEGQIIRVKIGTKRGENVMIHFQIWKRI